MGKVNIELTLSILIVYPLLKNKGKGYSEMVLTKPILIFGKMKGGTEKILES